MKDQLPNSKIGIIVKHFDLHLMASHGQGDNEHWTWLLGLVTDQDQEK